MLVLQTEQKTVLLYFYSTPINYHAFIWIASIPAHNASSVIIKLFSILLDFKSEFFH